MCVAARNQAIAGTPGPRSWGPLHESPDTRKPEYTPRMGSETDIQTQKGSETDIQFQKGSETEPSLWPGRSEGDQVPGVVGKD